MKTQVLSENYFLPRDLERQIRAFVTQHNNHQYHESLANLTPTAAYHERGVKSLKMREEIKKQTSTKLRFQHQAAAALTQTETEPEPPFRKQLSPPNNSDNRPPRKAL